MFCLPKPCNNEKTALKNLSATVMLLGGMLGIIYFGWRLMEKLRPLCKKKLHCDCGCNDDTTEPHSYDHVSEGDCLSHDAKDYYGKCGCFDNADGCADSDDKDATL